MYYTILKADYPNCSFGDTTSVNLIKLLKTKWDELYDQSDVVKYKLDLLKERIVDDKYLILLNPDRGTKRRMPQQIDNILQPFDGSKFNFTKISTNEILFNLKRDESEIYSVVINVSPISRYHCLLCPSISKCLPQIITEESLVVALDIMFVALHRDRDLRILFNSLCAMASMNHLHYHLMFEPKTLPVETAKCIHLRGSIFYFQDYIIPAFCCQIESQESVEASSKEIFKLVSYFLNNSIAHNLLITRGDSLVPGVDMKEVVRVIIWPRKNTSREKKFDMFNIAALELSGMFPVYEETVFENLKAEDIEQELKKWKIDNFDVLCENVKYML